MSVTEDLKDAAQRFSQRCDEAIALLEAKGGVAHATNPLNYAWPHHEQYIAKVLGDSPATVEQYYCEFQLDAEDQRKHNKGKHRRKQRIPATHTAQPAGLMRPVHPRLTGRQHDMVQSMRALGIGTEEFDPVGDGPYGEGDGDQDGGVDAGGFEPPAFWLQTRRSSN